MLMMVSRPENLIKMDRGKGMHGKGVKTSTYRNTGRKVLRLNDSPPGLCG